MRITWGKDNTYEQGLDRGVLYLPDEVVPWVGLTAVTEIDTSELNANHYFDGQRIRLTQDIGNFAARIEAYSYPTEFEPFDGYDTIISGQPRRHFGFSWRNQSGSGHKIHIVYAALALPAVKTRKTLTAVPEPSNFSWDISTIAVDVPGARPTAHIVVDTNDCYPAPLAAFEDMLYGTDDTDPQIPSPDVVVDLFESFTTLRVTYNGDGTWTAEGPDEMIQEFADGSFQIDTPSAFYVDEDTYIISSM